MSTDSHNLNCENIILCILKKIGSESATKVPYENPVDSPDFVSISFDCI